MQANSTGMPPDQKVKKAEELTIDISNKDCLTACTASLGCFISTVNGLNKKEALEDCR
jgi:hypothetical protein